LITHRINSVENGLFVTKGDDNDRPDKHMVSKEEIVGKVIFSVPFFGYVFNFFKTKFGLSLIIAGGLIIMFSEVRKLCCIKKQ
jgi:signal peptidase